MSTTSAPPVVESWTVRMVPNPSPTPSQPWLPSAAAEVPALVDDATGRPKRFLGFDTPLDEATTKAEAVLSGWATPRTVVSRVDLGDAVQLSCVVGPVVG